MSITVLNKLNTPTGPFTRAQVAEKLRTGEFSLDDLAFVEGLAQWTPLRDVLARVDAALPPVPPPALPLSVPLPVPSPGPAAYSYAATMQPPSHLVYGGFWLRFVAYLIDALILGLPIAIIASLWAMGVGGFAVLTGGINHSPGNDSSNDAANTILPVGIILTELMLAAAILVIFWLYYALLESGPWQSTFGKRVMGLRVTNMAGERISFAHASGRFFGKVITGVIPFAMGYIMAGFTAHKQALHDIIAGTLVVRN
jgi:uncharacterized RDD family membrane protein YckC